MPERAFDPALLRKLSDEEDARFAAARPRSRALLEVRSRGHAERSADGVVRQRVRLARPGAHAGVIVVPSTLRRGGGAVTSTQTKLS